MRLKRVFGKIGRYSAGKHRISATPENANDLEWFLSRYPMEVKEPDRLRTAAQAHKDSVQLVADLLSGRTEAPAFELAIPAREYQKVAAAIVLAKGGLLLADDVGIGKTASAICTLTDPRTRPAAVVTLTHLTRQWKAEIERFAPNLNVRIAKKSTPQQFERSVQLNLGTFPDVLVLNYHKLAGWADLLAQTCKSVIFDECQELRNGRGREKPQKYTAAEHLSGSVRFRMGLSATPIYNYGGEIFSVLECITPGALGSWSEFETEWCHGWDQRGAKIKEPRAFGYHLRDAGIMLRRTRSDVGRELPSLQCPVHYVDSDPAELERVSGSCAELAKLILSDSEAERGIKMRASEQLSNTIRQATGIAKAPYVAEFVRLLIESGEKVVLYGWHRTVYSIWSTALSDYKPVFFTGEESTNQKEEAKQKFINGETSLLIISLRAGAGLDGLQKVCRTVVFGELDWSPGVHEQCIGRVHRDGQADPVLAYYLVAEDGADPIMTEVLGLKRKQIEGIRNKEGELFEKLETDGGHIRRLAEAYLKKNEAAA